MIPNGAPHLEYEYGGPLKHEPEEAIISHPVVDGAPAVVHDVAC